MKNILWKELRENLKWAALAFFGLLLAEVFTLSSGRETVGSRFNGITLCSDAFLMVSAFGCAAIGAALGALQILPELRRDQWASLLHRPIPRHMILLGKVAAGLLLYSLATGLPLLVSVLYVALPGHFAAPFVPGLAAPAVSDLLLGMVFYLTAILLGLHSGRWFGARGAIALGAVAVMTLHLSEGWPFALPVAASVVLFIAAWGAMLGSVAVRPWISRLALGATILAGVEAGLLLVGAPLRSDAGKWTVFDSFSGFSIENNGSVLFWKPVGKKGHRVTDEHGNVVPDERYGDDNSGLYPLLPYPLANRAIPRARSFDKGSRSSQGRVEVMTIDHQNPELWYIIDGPRSYFIGYDKLSARCIGICDADGFKSPGATPRSFVSKPEREPLQSPPILFWVGPQAYAVDFAERRLNALPAAKADPIYGALKFPYTSDHPRIAIALKSTVQILDLTGAPVFTLPYGHDSKLWPNVSITATDNFSRTFLIYTPPTSPVPKSPDDTSHLDILDAQGQRIASYTTPENPLIFTPTWGARLAHLLSLPLSAVAARYRTLDPDINAAVIQSGSAILPELDHRDLSALFALAFILSVIAYRWARRSGLSAARTVIWVALTLFFGLAGFLAYRLSTNWPTLVRCPRCAQKRPVNTIACPHCHEAWQPLPLNGAEIFDPA